MDLDCSWVSRKLYEAATQECLFRLPKAIKENWWGELLIRLRVKRRRFEQVESQVGETVTLTRIRSLK